MAQFEVQSCYCNSSFHKLSPIQMCPTVTAFQLHYFFVDSVETIFKFPLTKNSYRTIVPNWGKY